LARSFIAFHVLARGHPGWRAGKLRTTSAGTAAKAYRVLRAILTTAVAEAVGLTCAEAGGAGEGNRTLIIRLEI